MPTQVNTQRIAKNTLLLYGRMLIIMAVTLYTNQLVLKTLLEQRIQYEKVAGGFVNA